MRRVGLDSGPQQQTVAEGPANETPELTSRIHDVFSRRAQPYTGLIPHAPRTSNADGSPIAIGARHLGSVSIEDLIAGPAGEFSDNGYRASIEALAGERDVVVDGKKLRFHNRYIGSRKNQLDEVALFLRQYYAALGLKVDEQEFEWRGRTVRNVVVTIPGKSAEQVVLCDHYDAADKEQIENRVKPQAEDYHLTADELTHMSAGWKVGHAVPGADDNASATATLMQAGRMFKAALDRGERPAKTIKLVHLTGEEFPGNCLGGKHFVSEAEKRGEKIAAAVVLDMIAVNRSGHSIAQISVGKPEASGAIADTMTDAADGSGLHLFRRPYHTKTSFLHQTDGITFSRAGIPVVLLNEWVNDRHDLFRLGYHDQFDTTRLIDFRYAGKMARLGIETVARLAGLEK